MKKTLIALATLAAVSGTAFAQSSVTISGGYGLAVGTSKFGADSSGAQIVRQTGNLNFAGTEDLGGGLKANFQLQTSIGSIATTNTGAANGATAPATLGDRGANVSLSGGFGTAFVGRGASAVRGLWGAIGDVSQLPVPTGISAGAGASGDDGARVIYGDAYSNYVAYATPAMNGFSASVALAPVQTANVGTGAANKDTTSFSLQYANGPLAAAVNLTDAAATGGYKLTTILASYDFGVAKIGVTQQSVSLNAGGVNPGDGVAVTAAAPIGAGILSAGFGKRSASASTSATFGDDVKQTFVGYRYNLSKRTNVSLVSNKLNRTGSANDLTETHLVVGHTF
jgi:general bacterial porin, GBP family